MTPAVLEAPRTLFADDRSAQRAGGPRMTLAELLDDTWRAARAHGEAECPLCHAAMRLEDDAARCGGCGTMLA
jgi:hypothetical protein